QSDWIRAICSLAAITSLDLGWLPRLEVDQLVAIGCALPNVTSLLLSSINDGGPWPDVVPFRALRRVSCKHWTAVAAPWPDTLTHMTVLVSDTFDSNRGRFQWRCSSLTSLAFELAPGEVTQRPDVTYLLNQDMSVMTHLTTICIAGVS